jgi:hypothetical protein
LFGYNFGLSRRQQADTEESKVLAAGMALSVTKVSLAQNSKG